MSRFVWMASLALAVWAAPANAQYAQGWSVLSGQTVGANADVISAQLGWPGLSFTYLHGLDQRLDFGVRVTPLNYGFEGRVTEVFPGLKLQGVVRLGLVDSGRFSLGLEFAPGPMVYFRPRNDSQWGIALPLKLQMGLAVGSAIIVNFGLDVPMFVTFSYPRALWVPVLFGGGVEYFIDRRLAVTFNLRAGPSIPLSGPAETELALEALFGVAYRF